MMSNYDQEILACMGIMTRNSNTVNLTPQIIHFNWYQQVFLTGRPMAPGKPASPSGPLGPYNKRSVLTLIFCVHAFIFSSSEKLSINKFMCRPITS